jgi:hypothetical protein
MNYHRIIRQTPRTSADAFRDHEYAVAILRSPRNRNMLLNIILTFSFLSGGALAIWLLY